MPSKDKLEHQFLFVGNHLCLDFINTEMVVGGQPVDRLVNFDSLVAWLLQSGTLEERHVQDILRTWKDSRQADSAFQNALSLRRSLRQMAERLAKRKSVPQATVNVVNESLSHQTGHAELKRA